MTGSRANSPADSADHPLRAALAAGDRAAARSGPLLEQLIGTDDCSFVSDAVVAQVGGMMADMAQQALAPRGIGASAQWHEEMTRRLAADPALRSHCHALALEWRLALSLERDLALDPVLSPMLQGCVASGDATVASTAMAAISAQARFAQAQRRMQLPLGELPAELFHALLMIARQVDAGEGGVTAGRAEARLRETYDEGSGRIALLARLASMFDPSDGVALAIEDAGAGLWLSVVAARSGETRERTAFATADPALGRLLLTLRAAGAAPAEAERLAMRIMPDGDLPRGLADVGTREAAQWLAQALVDERS